MKFLKDEAGQGAAEYILLFGGVIVIAIAALVIYRAYFSENSGLDAAQDVQSVRTNMQNNG
ncbi:class III signal peptide-containing protein [Methanobacterium alcaliphilum]|uniref:class III signal peptide-containing protein n=1 Tax=Methanobacterium alcaliphilum TaxID=392018 RepID=UPI00200B5556|nr:class III signal peptide-containing protein [Methanobacterium alcaliphilum]MCK9151289.1 class III signal peptide-containing protein [Methanobacterium alcaliphilum]